MKPWGVLPSLLSPFFYCPFLRDFCRLVTLISLVGSDLYVCNMAVRVIRSLLVIFTAKGDRTPQGTPFTNLP
jgi:hypothetical protein